MLITCVGTRPAESKRMHLKGPACTTCGSVNWAAQAKPACASDMLHPHPKKYLSILLHTTPLKTLLDMEQTDIHGTTHYAAGSQDQINSFTWQTQVAIGCTCKDAAKTTSGWPKNACSFPAHVLLHRGSSMTKNSKEENTNHAHKINPTQTKHFKRCMRSW